MYTQQSWCVHVQRFTRHIEFSGMEIAGAVGSYYFRPDLGLTMMVVD
jgi:hypothetical protein